MQTELTLRLSGRRALTDRIEMFEFVAADGTLPRFEAGAHIEMQIDANLRRCYSLANDPEERHHYVIAVLREGDGSRWMHEKLRVGDTIGSSTPRNGFPLVEAASEHILLAGGIGITPLRAMAYRLRALGAPFRLIYCTRDWEATAFGQDLRETFGARLTVHLDQGDASRSLDLAKLLAEQPAGAHLYVCGPRKMIDAARAAAAHWAPDCVHFELFASPTATTSLLPPETAEDTSFEVELRRRNLVLQVLPGQTILEAMYAAGLKAPCVCREGWCGNCQLPLLEGRADHRDDVLTEEERAKNTLIQTCVSRAAPGEKRLVIDY